MERTESKHDYEKGTEVVSDAVPVLSGERPLKRQLKSRHIQMISIGGVIGTGLFLGTAGALRNGGPLGLLLGYMVMGSICFAVMICLGEMISHLPIPGGHISLAARFADPALGFAMGWNYWYNWTIVLPAELNAAAVLISYWSDLNPAIWITVCLIVTVAINLGGTEAYGEMEFWFAIIKVITIVGLIILGVILDAGGGPDRRVIGFSNWNNPGPFVQYLGIAGSTGRFLGFWAVLIQAAFSYIGTEIVAITAGEAKNPRRNLPKAIRRVYIRILLFYILGTFIIGLLVSSADPRLNLRSGTATSSPFVIAITDSGIPVLPSIINAALLTSAWSAASSDLYTSSRALYGLALNGQAPKFLTRVSRYGLPYWTVIVGIAFSFLSYMSSGSSISAGRAFGYFANMTATCGLITWATICWTYIRFYAGMKAQGIDRLSLPYVAPLQPYATWYALIFIMVILFFNGFAVFLQPVFDVGDFLTAYIPMALFPILYFSYRFATKGKVVPVAELDFYSGSRDIEEEEELPPKNFVEKAWRAIM